MYCTLVAQNSKYGDHSQISFPSCYGRHEPFFPGLCKYGHLVLWLKSKSSEPIAQMCCQSINLGKCFPFVFTKFRFLYASFRVNLYTEDISRAKTWIAVVCL